MTSGSTPATPARCAERHPVENSFADSWTAGTSVRAVTNRRERLYQLDRLLARPTHRRAGRGWPVLLMWPWPRSGCRHSRSRRACGFGAAVASACTADALDRDAEHVVLFADLANPTSNAIYPEIGYRPIADREVVRSSHSLRGTVYRSG